MELKTGTSLQGGKYRIERVLGKGGFGITYLAYQKGLNRYVAVKEFFMSDYCNREESTCAVSIPSVGSREMVEKYRSKFVKEAQTIAELDNKHIVPIFDVFEENGTAYYVMKYIGGGSLSSLVKKGEALSLDVALKYVRQVAEALAYCHKRNIAHLDVKPGNILIQDGMAILIDFGISKHYNEGGDQTSSTPVGISKGYAPLEQYKKGGVTTFSSVTDIYSLGAVLFRLVTGQTPPDADEVNEEGLPEFPSAVPQYVQDAITAAMQPKKKDRPQSVDDLLALLVEPAVEDVDMEDTELEDDSEDTELTDDIDCAEGKSEGADSAEEKYEEVPESGKTPTRPHNKRLLYGVAGVLIVVVAVICILWGISSPEKRETGYSNGILKVNGIEYPMVYVEGGSFMMGSDDSDAISDEKPVHRVTLSSYRIGKYEVTQDLWEAVMGSNPSHFKGSKRPVESVSWDDCQEFIRKLNALTGQNFCLPTEAQWEFAARGGNNSNGYIYSGSNNIDKVAWYNGYIGNRTRDVGRKSPNELDIYDMSGNVSEWCSDWYGAYGSSSETNPSGPSSGSGRVLRGGDRSNAERICRVSCRHSSAQSHSKGLCGLRLCLPLNAPECEVSYSNGILKVNGIEYPMVYVAEGSFMMGSDNIYIVANPAHRVTLSSYRIGKYEVTQDLWEAVMGINPSDFIGSRRPVENVSWNDCQEFIRKLNVLTSQNFCLPTEAQWEFAARGGTSSNGYKYSGSNNIDKVAWYGGINGNSGNRTHNVGTKSPNELDIYDMSGNVSEWCSDWYGAYGSNSETNPSGPLSGSYRVIRGSDYFDAIDSDADYSRLFIRIHAAPTCRNDGLGFRLCL